jgi:ATP-dependent DNA helicase RecG
VSKATASRDIKVLEKKGLLKNIGTKGSSAIYKIKVDSVGLLLAQMAHDWLRMFAIASK